MIYLTEEQSKVSIPDLYKNIALILFGKEGSQYDCTKIEVGQSIMDACIDWHREQGGTDTDFAMLWCCYGPKATLDGYAVEVQEGWCII